LSKTQTKWIADSAVTKEKLNSDVAGDGLSGGAGSAIAIDLTGVTPWSDSGEFSGRW